MWSRSILVSLSLCFAVAADVHARIQPPSLEDLRGFLEQSRAQIESVEARTVTEASINKPGFVKKHVQHLTWSASGSILCGRESIVYWMPDGTERATGRADFAFNGQRSVQIGHDAKTARYRLGISDATTMLNNEVCQLNRFTPVDEPSASGVPHDLADVVQSAMASVRPVEELVGDRLCTVVDVRVRPDRPVSDSIWIDTERACVVLKWQSNHEDGTPLVQYEASQVEEVAPGVWFAVSGVKTISGLGEYDGTWAIEVAKQNGKTAFVVNTPVDPQLFSPSIPSGYTVMDENNSIYTVP